VGPAQAAGEGVTPLAPDRDRGREHQRLRQTHAGLVVASYSSLKRRGVDAQLALGGSATEPLVELELEPLTGGETTQAALEPPGPDEVPGGAESGVFLHAVIEELPIEVLAARPTLAEFRRMPGVPELFRREADRRNVPPRCLPHAQRLVHTALFATVRLGQEGPLVHGLGQTGRPVREMGFLFPADPRAGAAQERGYIKGYIDYIFEHQGRVYLCDWKSDRLPSYEPAALRTYVGERYDLQAQLYLQALVRALGIDDARAYDARIGGLLYCFLRGLDPDGGSADGLHFDRPSWDEVRAWAERLASAELDAPGGRR
jgi:exodeoxyribonuclease V beta subunit